MESLNERSVSRSNETISPKLSHCRRHRPTLQFPQTSNDQACNFRTVKTMHIKRLMNKINHNLPLLMIRAARSGRQTCRACFVSQYAMGCFFDLSFVVFKWIIRTPWALHHVAISSPRGSGVMERIVFRRRRWRKCRFLGRG